ncbi:hypothetical protein GOP47_0011955, partial [Adiantum capillus-veneris]
RAEERERERERESLSKQNAVLLAISTRRERERASERASMSTSSIDENKIIHSPSGNSWIATIEESILAHQLVVTMFGASWSEHSKAVYDMMVQQKKLLPDVMFCKVDVDEAKEIALEMGVRIIPTVVFIQEGKEVGRIKRPSNLELLLQKTMSFVQVQ